MIGWGSIPLLLRWLLLTGCVHQAPASGPYHNRCQWSEWRCAPIVASGATVGCYAHRGRYCCDVGACPASEGDDYQQQELLTREQQLAAGVICRQLPIGQQLFSGAQASAASCPTEPQFDGSKFPPPAWCPWTSWSSWTMDCWLGGPPPPLEQLLPRELADLLASFVPAAATASGNDNSSAAVPPSGWKYGSRTRGCYCPASPDGNYTCPGARRQWRARRLPPPPPQPQPPLPLTTSAATVDCQWCSWQPWQATCDCGGNRRWSRRRRRREDGDGRRHGQLPQRRRGCVCSNGAVYGGAAGNQSDNDGVCRGAGGGSSAVELAPSVEAVCRAVCSGGRGGGAGGRASRAAVATQFLNPLAIGFAVYLLMALAAFLVCKLFCGDPRHSDANSRDQLSVDDFLSPPTATAAAAAAATSAV